jgi:DedD protein
MGYTSGTAMEDRGLRDIERWRDKIEVRLDNRQVFFLFFGSALVACMLFVLGVIVGKRLESRGRAVSPAIEDPLALLDKVATSPRPVQTGVTFPQALFGSVNKVATDKHARKNPLPAAGNGEEDSASHKALALAKPGEGAVAALAPTKVADKPARVKPAAKTEDKPTEVVAEEKSAQPAPSKTKPSETKESKSAIIPTVAAAGDSKSKGRYALQLSSFQDKSEAEAFAQKFESEHPYMVVSEIPGKGTWYRVRVGDYATAKDALAAKQSFEKKHSVIAYVAQK